MKIITLITLLITFNTGFAQLSSFDYNGYAKYLFSTFELPGFEERINDHLIHSRINTRWYPHRSVTASLELRTRIFIGNSVEKIPGYNKLIQSKQGVADLDLLLWESGSTIGYTEIDRLWIDWIENNLQVTVGRQRIAWGTSWAWNPTDLFNPREVLDFDYEELPGADALRIQYYTGPVSKIELAVSPARNKEDLIAAGLISFNKWNYDFNFIAGYKKERWVAGGGWSGDILDAGFRGEILVSAPPKRKTARPLYTLLGIKPLSTDQTSFSAVISGDYTFTNSFYIHTEVLYNSNGTDKPAVLYSQEASELGMLSPARWSIFQEFSYQISPLVKGGVFGIFNPDDKSRIIVPSLTWSVITNLDFYLTALLSGGKSLTEFGDYGSVFFVRMKYSF